LAVQSADGGFDTGYEYDFGLIKPKFQSSSPELLGLIALCQWEQLFHDGRVANPAGRAVDWATANARAFEDGIWAIPYAPLTDERIMIHNGTSFAAAALGCHLGVFASDPELHEIYCGMLRYTERALVSAPGEPGRYWPYADQSRHDLSAEQRRRVDYYHQAQQIEAHAIAQQLSPSEIQSRIIRDATEHLLYVCDQHEIPPYYRKGLDDPIHIWGLGAVIPAMLEASIILPDRRDHCVAVARRVADWILEHSWNGEYFYPVVGRTGEVILEDYMVRSDAWTFNAMAAAEAHLGPGRWSSITRTCFQRIAACDFSGPENHASTAMSRRIRGTCARIWSALRV
jgi:hypothetical protein